MIKRVSLAVCLVVVAGCSSNVSAEAGSESDLTTVDGQAFQLLIDSSDKPMVVNFWASWCPPCRSEMPLFVSAHSALGEEVRFIGIASDDTQDGAAGFIEEFGIEFENYLDGPGEVKGLYGGAGLPMTLFVDAGGEVVDRHYGIIDDAALAIGIDELLQR
jgi:thiol-disulfide isomerase/thioredoxin